MNTRILLLVLGMAALSSCSSVYKSGQTPDDVYFSPGRPQADTYVEVKKEREGSNYQTYEQYQDAYRDDRFLRMSVGNPYYLNTYNSYSGFDWRYNSFYDGFNYGFNSPWNNYFAWNNFYNPYGYGSPYLSYGGYGGYYGGGGGYYGGGVKYVSSNMPISKPVAFSLNSYNSNSNRPVSRNYIGNTGNTSNMPRYNNTNSGNNRNYYNNTSSNNHPAYTPSNSSANTNTYTPSRSYTPSSSGSSSGSSSSSSSSSGGGGGGVSRPTRGN